MNDREIYTKTELGREEIRTRALHLPAVLRSILLLVDGVRTVAQLREVVASGKAPADALDQLLAQGLIELHLVAAKTAIRPGAASVTPPPPPTAAPPAPPAAVPAPAAPVAEVVAASSKDDPSVSAASSETERFNRLYALMNQIVADYMGLRGYFMQMKIEKCETANELLGLQAELRAAVAKGHGEDVANDLIARIRAASA